MKTIFLLTLITVCTIGQAQPSKELFVKKYLNMDIDSVCIAKIGPRVLHRGDGGEFNYLSPSNRARAMDSELVLIHNPIVNVLYMLSVEADTVYIRTQKNYEIPKKYGYFPFLYVQFFFYKDGEVLFWISLDNFGEFTTSQSSGRIYEPDTNLVNLLRSEFGFLGIYGNTE